MDMFDQLDKQNQATLAIMADKLSGGKMTKRQDITITISQKKVAMKDYLAELLPGVDVDSAMNQAAEYMRDIDKRSE